MPINAAQQHQTSVSVVVRVRDVCPAVDQTQPAAGKKDEATTTAVPLCVAVPRDANQVTVVKPEPAKEQRTFTFDRVFSSVDSAAALRMPGLAAKNQPIPDPASQYDVFEATGKLAVQHSMQGYNACILAYGQTGSGKTHTMVGPPAAVASGDFSDAGVIPRVCSMIFDQIRAMTAAAAAGDPRALQQYTCVVSATFFEVYNEQVNCLLSEATNLSVRQAPNGDVLIPDLHAEPLQSTERAMEVMQVGLRHRHTGRTAMNDRSSRSHAIFQLRLRQTYLTPGGDLVERTSRVNLVDLAGSERCNKTQAVGDRFREGVAINSGLTHLGQVIQRLARRSDATGASGASDAYVNYRNSILTWVLRDDLGGNSKTLMIAAVSPAAAHVEETLSTLRYANEVKKIRNNAVVNEDHRERLIRELKQELAALRLQNAQRSSGDFAVGAALMSAAAPPAAVATTKAADAKRAYLVFTMMQPSASLATVRDDDAAMAASVTSDGSSADATKSVITPTLHAPVFTGDGTTEVLFGVGDDGGADDADGGRLHVALPKGCIDDLPRAPVAKLARIQSAADPVPTWWVQRLLGDDDQQILLLVDEVPCEDSSALQIMPGATVRLIHAATNVTLTEVTLFDPAAAASRSRFAPRAKNAAIASSSSVPRASVNSASRGSGQLSSEVESTLNEDSSDTERLAKALRRAQKDVQHWKAKANQLNEKLRDAGLAATSRLTSAMNSLAPSTAVSAAASRATSTAPARNTSPSPLRPADGTGPVMLVDTLEVAPAQQDAGMLADAGGSQQLHHPRSLPPATRPNSRTVSTAAAGGARMHRRVASSMETTGTTRTVLHGVDESHVLEEFAARRGGHSNGSSATMLSMNGNGTMPYVDPSMMLVTADHGLQPGQPPPLRGHAVLNNHNGDFTMAVPHVHHSVDGASVLTAGSGRPTLSVAESTGNSREGSQAVSPIDAFTRQLANLRTVVSNLETDKAALQSQLLRAQSERDVLLDDGQREQQSTDRLALEVREELHHRRELAVEALSGAVRERAAAADSDEDNALSAVAAAFPAEEVVLQEVSEALIIALKGEREAIDAFSHQLDAAEERARVATERYDRERRWALQAGKKCARQIRRLQKRLEMSSTTAAVAAHPVDDNTAVADRSHRSSTASSRDSGGRHQMLLELTDTRSELQQARTENSRLRTALTEANGANETRTQELDLLMSYMARLNKQLASGAAATMTSSSATTCAVEEVTNVAAANEEIDAAAPASPTAAVAPVPTQEADDSPQAQQESTSFSSAELPDLLKTLEGDIQFARSARAELDQANATLRLVQADLADTVAHRDSLAAELSDLRSAARALWQGMPDSVRSRATSPVPEAEDVLVVVQQRLVEADGLRSQIDSGRSAAEAAEQRAAEAEQRLDAAETSARELQSAVDAEKSRVAELTSELTARVEEVREKDAELAEALTLAERAVASENEARRVYDEAAAAVRTLEERLAEQAEVSAEQDLLINELEQEAKRRDSLVNEVRAVASDRRAEVAALLEQLEVSKAECDELRQRLDIAQENAAEADAATNDAEERLETAKRSIMELEAKLTLARTTHEQQQQQRPSEEMQRQMTALQAQHTAAVTARSEAEARLADISAELSAVDAFIDEWFRESREGDDDGGIHDDDGRPVDTSLGKLRSLMLHFDIVVSRHQQQQQQQQQQIGHGTQQAQQQVQAPRPDEAAVPSNPSLAATQSAAEDEDMLMFSRPASRASSAAGGVADGEYGDGDAVRRRTIGTAAAFRPSTPLAHAMLPANVASAAMRRQQSVDAAEQRGASLATNAASSRPAAAEVVDTRDAPTLVADMEDVATSPMRRSKNGYDVDRLVDATTAELGELRGAFTEMVAAQQARFAHVMEEAVKSTTAAAAAAPRGRPPASGVTGTRRAASASASASSSRAQTPLAGVSRRDSPVVGRSARAITPAARGVTRKPATSAATAATRGTTTKPGSAVKTTSTGTPGGALNTPKRRPSAAPSGSSLRGTPTSAGRSVVRGSALGGGSPAFLQREQAAEREREEVAKRRLANERQLVDSMRQMQVENRQQQRIAQQEKQLANFTTQMTRLEAQLKEERETGEGLRALLMSHDDVVDVIGHGVIAPAAGDGVEVPPELDEVEALDSVVGKLDAFAASRHLSDADLPQFDARELTAIRVGLQRLINRLKPIVVTLTKASTQLLLKSANQAQSSLSIAFNQAFGEIRGAVRDCSPGAQAADLRQGNAWALLDDDAIARMPQSHRTSLLKAMRDLVVWYDAYAGGGSATAVAAGGHAAGASATVQQAELVRNSVAVLKLARAASVSELGGGPSSRNTSRITGGVNGGFAITKAILGANRRATRIPSDFVMPTATGTRTRTAAGAAASAKPAAVQPKAEPAATAAAPPVPALMITPPPSDEVVQQHPADEDHEPEPEPRKPAPSAPRTAASLRRSVSHQQAASPAPMRPSRQQQQDVAGSHRRYQRASFLPAEPGELEACAHLQAARSRTRGGSAKPVVHSESTALVRSATVDHKLSASPPGPSRGPSVAQRGPSRSVSRAQPLVQQQTMTNSGVKMSRFPPPPIAVPVGGVAAAAASNVDTENIASPDASPPRRSGLAALAPSSPLSNNNSLASIGKLQSSSAADTDSKPSSPPSRRLDTTAKPLAPFRRSLTQEPRGAASAEASQRPSAHARRSGSSRATRGSGGGISHCVSVSPPVAAVPAEAAAARPTVRGHGVPIPPLSVLDLPR